MMMMIDLPWDSSLLKNKLEELESKLETNIGKSVIDTNLESNLGLLLILNLLMNQHKQWQNVIIMIIYLYILFMDNLLSKKMVNFVFGEKSGISCKKDLKDCAC